MLALEPAIWLVVLAEAEMVFVLCRLVALVEMRSCASLLSRTAPVLCD